MKVNRLKKKRRTGAGKAAARKAKRKVSKPRRARRKARSPADGCERQACRRA